MSDKIPDDSDGGIVTSATGGKVYHQPDGQVDRDDLDDHAMRFEPPALPALPEAPVPSPPKRVVGRPAVRGKPGLALVATPAAPASAPPPPTPPPAPPPVTPVDDARARARAIVDAAKFTRTISKKDPAIELIEIRHRASTSIGEPGTVTTYTGDEALMELAQFCTDFLISIGYLPPQVDEYTVDDDSCEVFNDPS